MSLSIIRVLEETKNMKSLLKLQKKGMAANAKGVTTAVIAVVIITSIAVALWPTLENALGNLSAASGLPLASLYSAGGVVAILFSVGLFYGIAKMFGF